VVTASIEQGRESYHLLKDFLYTLVLCFCISCFSYSDIRLKAPLSGIYSDVTTTFEIELGTLDQGEYFIAWKLRSLNSILNQGRQRLSLNRTNTSAKIGIKTRPLKDGVVLNSVLDISIYESMSGLLVGSFREEIEIHSTRSSVGLGSEGIIYGAIGLESKHIESLEDIDLKFQLFEDFSGCSEFDRIIIGNSVSQKDLMKKIQLCLKERVEVYIIGNEINDFYFPNNKFLITHLDVDAGCVNDRALCLWQSNRIKEGRRANMTYAIDGYEIILEDEVGMGYINIAFSGYGGLSVLLAPAFKYWNKYPAAKKTLVNFFKNNKGKYYE